MDLGASTAFVLEPADSDAMDRPPQRAAARFFDREMLTWIVTSAGCMAGCVLTCYGYGLARVRAVCLSDEFFVCVSGRVDEGFVHQRKRLAGCLRPGIFAGPARV